MYILETVSFLKRREMRAFPDMCKRFIPETENLNLLVERTPDVMKKWNEIVVEQIRYAIAVENA